MKIRCGFDEWEFASCKFLGVPPKTNAAFLERELAIGLERCKKTITLERLMFTRNERIDDILRKHFVENEDFYLKSFTICADCLVALCKLLGCDWSAQVMAAYKKVTRSFDEHNARYRDGVENVRQVTRKEAEHIRKLLETAGSDIVAKLKIVEM